MPHGMKEQEVFLSLPHLQDHIGTNAKRSNSPQVYTISALEIKKRMDEGAAVQFVDVRPPSEFEIIHIPGAINIPKSILEESLDQLDRDKLVVIYCRFGIKSTAIARNLRENHGIAMAYALREGLLEWAIDVDPDLPKDLI